MSNSSNPIWQVASIECMEHCSIVRGPVTDVRAATLKGGDEVVVLVGTNGNGPIDQTSVPLYDLGPDSTCYLDAVDQCSGPTGKRSFFGNRGNCAARVGDYALQDYVIES
jgi:hypothetical protein